MRLPAPGVSAAIAATGLAVAFLIGLLLAWSPKYGLGATVVALYLPVILLNLALGIALWVPVAFLPASGLGPSFVGVLIIGAWLIILPVRSRAVAATLQRHSGLAAALGLLLVWITVSTAWTPDPRAARLELIYWGVAAIVLDIVATSLTTRRQVVGVIAAFLVGALISAVIGLASGSAAAKAGSEASRLTGSFADPNFLAAGLVPALALAVGLGAVLRSARARYLLLAASAVLAIGLAATGSRGGIIAAIVAVLVTLFVMRGRRLPVVGMILAAVAISGFWIATSSPGTWDRVREFDTGNGRVDLWTIAWRMSKANPVTGVGLYGFKDESANYFRQPGRLPSGQEAAPLILEQPHEAHNTYLQALAETGFIGLGLLLGVIFGALRASLAAASRFELGGDPRFAALARGVFIAQVACLTASLYISNPYDRRTWILLGLGPAMLAVATRERPQAS